jgi:hypothetical protein
MNHLDDLKELAIRSYYGTSFSPERRGETTINELNDVLNSDLEEIKEATEEQKADYIKKFRSLFSSWLSAQSRCVSTMIAGPANFPVRRMQKYNEWERNKYEAFEYWRSKAKKAIIKSTLPEKTTGGELEKSRMQLESMKKNHELMKEGNKRIKEALKKGENIDKYLTDVFNIQPHMLEWTMKFGFGLQNSNANIKRVEERIKELERRDANATKENKVIPFDGGNVIVNWSLNRVQIQHDSKPDYSVISSLKHGGFHWSPSERAWQRQLTRDAIWKAESLTGAKLTV